ncbi:MAG TPA: fibronectin type III domain-containing protein [Terriglobia bacterium]|nr:fibronectin type III domain-containing protein [Terriglobia bacterium]
MVRMKCWRILWMMVVAAATLPPLSAGGQSRPRAVKRGLANPKAAARAAAPQSAAWPGVVTPAEIPPRRSSEITDGFGINSDLPRDPYLPWNRWWWTRMFDAGVKWIRIGQYENSSDQTSWDWIEPKRGVLSVSPELDDYVNSLVDNGVEVQVQLLYGNPMYTSPAGRRPDSIVPEPGSFHNPDRSLYSVFWPPTTPEQIDAFIRYVKFMVNHFRGRIHYWALWNEQDIDYWNPSPNPEDYGRLLKAFVPAVHETDPEAKVIYGGQAWPLSGDFTRRALGTCQCASGIDVIAYHIYPNYGHNLNPEAVDDRAHAAGGGKATREMLAHYPGMRPGVQFWCDEFNSIPSWTNMDDSVQSKYIPRQLVYNWAAGVKTFVWLLAAGTDGNEYDDFGMIHGLRYLPDDFTPRPVYYALAHSNWLFSNTHFDSTVHVESAELNAVARRAGAPAFAYGFRAPSGKAIVAYWLGARSLPGSRDPGYTASLLIKGSGIRHPVLIDVVSGKITPLCCRSAEDGPIGPVPVRDSVLAIADADYFDWPVLPEAPSSLVVKPEVGGLRLTWEVHGAGRTGVRVERRIDGTAGQTPQGAGGWEKLATLPPDTIEYRDTTLAADEQASYRIRAVNAAGQSAYSNIARTGR